MIFLEDTKIKDLITQLGLINDKAFPYAARYYLNTVAFTARKHWQDEIKKTFINRNRFTVRSIRVTQTRSLNVRSMESITGSIADYMDDQEYGGVKRSKGGSHVNIPTATAAGQAEGTRPRTRPVRKPNRLANIRLKNGQITARNRRQRNLIAVKQARETGQKFVYMETDNSKGIFKVTRSRIKMVHDLSRKTVKIKREPTLYRSLQHTNKEIPSIAISALEQQIDRHTKFKRKF